MLLWSRSARGIDSGESIRCTTELADLAEAELLLFAVPSLYVGDLADALGRHLDGSHLLVHVSRGLVGDELTTVSEVLGSRTPCRRVGALAGPLVAGGLAKGQPGGAIIGSPFPEVIDAVSEAIGGPTLRVYGTSDLMGVEIASALVGLVALALGYAGQLGMGPGHAGRAGHPRARRGHAGGEVARGPSRRPLPDLRGPVI